MYFTGLLTIHVFLTGMALAMPQQTPSIVDTIFVTVTETALAPILTIITVPNAVPSQVTAGSCSSVTANPLRDNVCYDDGNVDDSICCPTGTACEAVAGSHVFVCN
jgi:hypothetical protein